MRTCKQGEGGETLVPRHLPDLLVPCFMPVVPSTLDRLSQRLKGPHGEFYLASEKNKESVHQVPRYRSIRVRSSINLSFKGAGVSPLPATSTLLSQPSVPWILTFTLAALLRTYSPHPWPHPVDHQYISLQSSIPAAGIQHQDGRLSSGDPFLFRGGESELTTTGCQQTVPSAARSTLRDYTTYRQLSADQLCSLSCTLQPFPEPDTWNPILGHLIRTTPERTGNFPLYLGTEPSCILLLP